MTTINSHPTNEIEDLSFTLESQEETASIYDIQFNDTISGLDSVVAEIQTPPVKRVSLSSERKIKYDTCFCRPNNYTPKQISFDDVDKYDFNNGFTEFLISEEYVHLYFDFDSINSRDQLIDVLKWLKSLEPVFGKYSVGGYTDDESIAEEFQFRYFKEGNHFVSMHTVFYTTAISTKDLVAIMKHTEKKGYSTKGIHNLCDSNVYKLVSKKDGQTIRQLFRHVLSDKIFKPNDQNNKQNHGKICNNLAPSTQIVQVRGNETIIEKNEWSKLFTLQEDIPITAKQGTTCDARVCKAAETTIDLSEAVCDLNYHDNLIQPDFDEIVELLLEFEPTYENFTSIASNLLHSPFEQEFCVNVIESWYFTGNHQNTQTIQLYADKYYELIENNKWFYSIVKHLPNDKRLQYLNKYAMNSIDPDAHIELTTEFSLIDLRQKDYSLPNGIGIKTNEFLSDLKKCVVIVNPGDIDFIVKECDGVRNTYNLKLLSYKSFERLLKSINLGKYYKEGKLKNVNAFMVYEEGKNKNLLIKRKLRFYDERPDVFSYFTGYEHTLLDEVNEGKIKGFLNYIREVIANNNEEVYEYILNWFSFIKQNPNGKTETAIVITGEQGTGKNVFTNILCDLLKRYSNRNITNIDHIIGKFNTSIENMKLIVCNELSSAETNKYLNSESLKSVITDKEINIEEKNISPRVAENVCNLILVSNNDVPVKLEYGDRRYVVSCSSSKYKGNNTYFTQLCASFDRDFYNNLFTFFMKRDIKKFNPRVFPQTEARDLILKSSQSSYELFIQENIARFIEGFPRKIAFEKYKKWVDENNFNQCSIKTFKERLMKFCIDTKITQQGARINVYKLKEDCKNRFDLTENNEEGDEYYELN